MTVAYPGLVIEAHREALNASLTPKANSKAGLQGPRNSRDFKLGVQGLESGRFKGRFGGQQKLSARIGVDSLLGSADIF